MRWPRLSFSVACLLAGLALLLVGGPGERGQPSALAQEDGAPALTQDRDGRPRIQVLTVEGAIGPAKRDYIRRGLEDAAAAGAEAVVLAMDTPGGLLQSTREINNAILDSSVPVATYVSPTGARAASAGTFILYASHVAAMAPGTTLGAATPIQMGGAAAVTMAQSKGDQGDETPQKDGQSEAPQNPLELFEDLAQDQQSGEDSQGGSGDQNDGDAQQRDAAEVKAIEDSVAYIRALANLRGRNADWAERAVREAATLTSDEAAEQNVADIMAEDLTALAAAMDGRQVQVQGRDVTLATAGATIERNDPAWHETFLDIITNPNIAFLFMMVGVYGIIFELANPGAVIPGTIGAISLLIGLYALNVLPLNIAGAALILLGLALMVAEALAPSFGILGLGGVAAFAVGALMLFDTDAPAYQLSPWIVGTITALTALLLIIVLRSVIRAHRRPVASGGENLLEGAQGQVTDWRHGTGQVFINGETWRAQGPAALTVGQAVRVTGADGLLLTVTPAEATAPSATSPQEASS